MDGYAVARALRANAAPATHVPIVAVTSYAMAGDREKALAAGCNGYIEKPINPETFVAELQAFAAGAAREIDAMTRVLIVDDKEREPLLPAGAAHRPWL